eukprot:scaffold417_cov252-Pinguiococcus_pyrenoidosus.AAC.27
MMHTWMPTKRHAGRRIPSCNFISEGRNVKATRRRKSWIKMPSTTANGTVRMAGAATAPARSRRP